MISDAIAIKQIVHPSRDELLQTFRTIEAFLGTLDHSEAVEESELPDTVRQKILMLIQKVKLLRSAGCCDV